MDVFISHSSENYEIAQSLCYLLHVNGITYWIAEQNELGGQSYIEGITDALDQCKVMLLLCSEASMKSKDVKQEIFYAYNHNIPIVPVMLGTVSLPKETLYILGALHRLTYAANELFCADLITAIRQELQVPARQTKAVPLPRVANHKIAWWVAAIAIVAVVALVAGLLLGRTPTPQPGGGDPAVTTTTTSAPDNGTTTTTPAPTTTTTTGADLFDSPYNQVPEQYRQELEQFIRQSSKVGQTHTVKVGQSDTPFLAQVWTYVASYSTDTRIATVNGNEITGVSPGVAYVVLISSMDQIQIFEITVIS